MAKNTYDSDLTFGEKYRDTATGVEGTLVALHFYKHACERGTLRYVNGRGEVIEQTFDAPELEHVESGDVARSKRPGGPDRGPGRIDPARRL